VFFPREEKIFREPREIGGKDLQIIRENKKNILTTFRKKEGREIHSP